MAKNADRSEQLCLDCGLCCNGSIFAWAAIEEEERQGLEELGFEIRQLDRRLGFLLPCNQHSGNKCTVYDGRPATCKTYRCVTLRALQRGKIAYAEAKRRVIEAKAAERRLIEACPGTANAAEARQHWIDSPSDRATDPAMARLHFLVIAFNIILDRHFRYEDQRTVKFMSND